MSSTLLCYISLLNVDTSGWLSSWATNSILTTSSSKSDHFLPGATRHRRVELCHHRNLKQMLANDFLTCNMLDVVISQMWVLLFLTTTREQPSCVFLLSHCPDLICSLSTIDWLLLPFHFHPLTPFVCISFDRRQAPEKFHSSRCPLGIIDQCWRNHSSPMRIKW